MTAAHRGAAYGWPERACSTCGAPFTPRGAPTVARYCSSRCRLDAAIARRAESSPRATFGRALAAAARALHVAAAVDERDFLWAEAGPAEAARLAFADVVEAGFALFSPAIHDVAWRRILAADAARRGSDRGAP